MITRLSVALREILTDPSFREAEARAGNVVAEYTDAAAFTAFVATEETRLRTVAAKVQLD